MQPKGAYYVSQHLIERDKGNEDWPNYFRKHRGQKFSDGLQHIIEGRSDGHQYPEDGNAEKGERSFQSAEFSAFWADPNFQMQSFPESWWSA